jgi:DNA polymerase-3 subunit beta
MKLYTLRETLLNPLQTVIGVVERKQTVPILSHVLLSVKGGRLSFTGTDTEIELIGQSDLEQAPEKDSMITLPGRKLIDICKALPEAAPIELYIEKNRAVLTSGQSRFVLSTLPANEFPDSEIQEAQVSIKIAQKDLKNLLQSTYFAIAQQDARFYLNGLLLEFQNGTLRAVATDGHRLATSLVEAPIHLDQKVQVIVPRKGVLELLRLLQEDDSVLALTVSSNHIRVSGADFSFTSKLIESRFPDYTRVIPKKGKYTVELDRGELKQALSRASVLCNDKFHGIRFEFRQNLLKIIANNPEQETAEEEITIDYQGDDIDIGFNISYLIDVLNVLKQNKVRLTFSESDGSIRIEEAESTQESIFVVMPMRL